MGQNRKWALRRTGPDFTSNRIFLFPNSPRPPFHILFLAFMLIERCPACGHAHRLDLRGSGRHRDGCPLANLYVIVF
jgi:hypothetical protein